MEILLNLAWAASAIVLVALWLRTRGRSGNNCRGQIIAIAVLVAILFPVISVSDDLMAAQCPSEADTSVRRNHLVSPDTNPVLPAIAIVSPPAFPGVTFRFLSYVSPGWAAESFAKTPALASIRNRPPPEA